MHNHAQIACISAITYGVITSLCKLAEMDADDVAFLLADQLAYVGLDWQLVSPIA